MLQPNFCAICFFGSDRRRMMKSRCLRRHQLQLQPSIPGRRRAPGVGTSGSCRVEVATVRQSQAAWRSDKTVGAAAAATDDDVVDCGATCWTQSDRSRRATVSHAGGGCSRSTTRCPFGSAGCGRRAHLSTGGSTPTALDISDVAFDDEYRTVFSTAASSSAAATMPHLKPAACDFVFDLVDGRFVRSPIGTAVATSCGRSVTSLSSSSNGGGLLVVAAAAAAATTADDQAATMATTTHGGNGNVKRCHAVDCAVDGELATFGGFIDASTVLSCQS
jgi:hypothetical protein